MTEVTDPAPSTRDRIIAAAELCLRRDGIRRTTMTGVAAQAEVSRAWLYRHFPDKSALVVATLARADDAFWQAAHDRVSAAPGLAAQVAEAVRFSLGHTAGALALHLQSEEPDAYAATVGIGLGASMPAMTLFWHDLLHEAVRRGEVRADLDVEAAANWILRIVVSLVLVPLAGDGDTLDRFVDAHLVRGLQ